MREQVQGQVIVLWPLRHRKRMSGLSKENERIHHIIIVEHIIVDKFQVYYL